MRVQLETGTRSVDVENTDLWQGADNEQVFFDLLKSALQALGYTELEMLVHLTGVRKQQKDEAK